MLTYTKLKRNRRKCVALTGLTPKEFGVLLPAFVRAYEEQYPRDKTMTGQPRKRQSAHAADAPGVARVDDKPLVSAELMVIADRPKRTTGTDANVPLRGVEPAAFEIRNGFKMRTGATPVWPLFQLMDLAADCGNPGAANPCGNVITHVSPTG